MKLLPINRQLKHLLSHITVIVKNKGQSKRVKAVCLQPSVPQIMLSIECCPSNMGKQAPIFNPSLLPVLTFLQSP